MALRVTGGEKAGVAWLRACGPAPQAIVLAPPLIGGHALTQLRMLRPLMRRNFDLLSFNYAGHGDSKGAFSFQAALDNTLTILDLAVDMRRTSGLPIFGLASCFAAVPLLHAAARRKEPFSKIVLINAVPHLRMEQVLADFLRYWRCNGSWRPTVRSLATALRNYLDTLFPHIVHQRHSFGILSRQRIKWPRMAKELFTLRKINRAPLPQTTVLCVYGRHDRLLRQLGFSDWSLYESLITHICPQAVFQPMDGGHFFSAPGVRQKLIAEVEGFLSAGA